MTLLHALHAAGIQRLVACHLDHGIRGAESRKDASLVRRTAARYGCEFESEQAGVPRVAREDGKSLELAARELRQAFFLRCALKHGCHRLLLAHHADDQIETILHNFLRGTGAAGLGGMKPVARFGPLEIHRPLLAVRRAEIEKYAASRRIVFREDATNASIQPTRNRLRHEILPVLARAFGDSVHDAILRAGNILRAEEEWMEGLVPPDELRLSCVTLRALPLAARRRTVLAWLRARGVPDPGFAETERVLTLLDRADGPAKVNLPGNRHARRTAGEIYLEP